MNKAVTGVSDTAERSESASRKAITELGVYFHGNRGKLRVARFICQVLVASTIVFALISLIDLGSLLLDAILLVANSPSVGGDHAQRFMMDLPTRNFILSASDVFVQHVTFNAIASLLLTATAEIYWTMRRASRLMPPARAFKRN
ncbi:MULTISPECIES: hypothetical protein [Pandoraea]|uniref:Uncharacterized protein n=2 Tax=Pandoraea TaxID=93217 RepID=A0A5E4XE01_9BURK|nr:MULTISPECIES: hypothetical protein [Pandoraea]VVE16674.1 hypothetical protein PCE31107_02931 [Pandoraea cepalis]VVE34506.1 hypothetical protein PTE31013_03852 [Pandoraea terrigena]